MTRYLSHRERKLLRWNELSIRGCSLQYSGVVDDDDGDEEEVKYRESTSVSSDEDNLFSSSIPTALFDLPLVLTASTVTIHCTLRHEFYQQQQKSNRAELLQLLRDYAFTNPKYTRYSRRLELPVTELDHGLSELCMLESDIFLDYLPLLRNMAVQERISEFIFKTSSSSDCRSTTQRFKTRRSKSLGRDQYFDKIIPSYTTKESNRTSKDIADRLANMSMLYKT